MGQNNDEIISCPICISPFQEPLISKCGHSFCEHCILEALKIVKKCPVCNAEIDSNFLFPNLTLQILQQEIDAKQNKLVKHKQENEELNPLVIKQFLTMLEEDRNTKLASIQKDFAKIKAIKERLNLTIEDYDNFKEIGSKRKIPIDLNSKDEEKLNRLEENFEELSKTFSSNNCDPDHWSRITKEIQSYTKTYRIQEIAAFKHGEELSTSSRIISSIESDNSGNYCATAGVLKRIIVYNLNKLVSDHESLIYTNHTYPILDIQSNAKISCLSWNPFYETKICSSDYDGVVKMYDTTDYKDACNSWTEHEKRCWSIDTSILNPRQIISGSDDGKVKLWSLQSQKSQSTLDIKANVCSVRFSPTDSNLIAVGSSDRRVFLFDLRKPSTPLLNEKKHSKSVSYVRFTQSSSSTSNSSIISASTDSTLRLWTAEDSNTGKWNSDHIYSGHCNEKNFVGLSVENGLIATGSEDNSVVIYDQNIKRPVIKYFMKTKCPLTGASEMDDETGTFVSCVSWSKGFDNQRNSILLAANSTGNIKVLSVYEE